MYETGVIPAAGAGMRLHPYTETIPKPLLPIGGKPLLQRNLEIMRDQLGVRRVLIIVGHLEDQIRSSLGTGEDLGIELEYITCRHVDGGLAQGLLDIRHRVDGPFPVILGDELYLDSTHEAFVSASHEDFSALCGIAVTNDPTLIRQNYGIELAGEQITSLTEKPISITNNYLGCGSYVLTPTIFQYIEDTARCARTGRVELTDALDYMARDRGDVYAVLLSQQGYRNVNTPGEYRDAVRLYRRTHFHEYRKSLVLPAFEEEASIGYVLGEFSGLVDEILVTDNRSADRTADIAREQGATVVSASFSGYGAAAKRALDEATGDILLLTEADGSFSPEDLPKILEYLKDAEMVVGTRTRRQMIRPGANMAFLLRWGNILAAKVLQLLWIHREPRFTDLGCTYRGLWRDNYLEIRDRLSAPGPAFSPEMMLEMLRIGAKVIEIPVTYRPRIGGSSKHSRGWLDVLRTGTQMLRLILRKR